MTIPKDANCGFKHKSNSVERTYDELMRKAKLRKNILAQIQKVEAILDELDYKFSIFDSVYSDADECPFTKESLNEEMECYEKQLSELKKELKELERY